MTLSIDSLKKMGAFTGAPVEKEVTWRQGGEEHTFTTYVRPLSYKSAVSEITEAKTGNSAAARIAASICDQEGKPVFTVEDITGEADPDNRGPLDHRLTIALLRVISEVNNLVKTES